MDSIGKRMSIDEIPHTQKEIVDGILELKLEDEEPLFLA